jgi:hypothetical protein
MLRTTKLASILLLSVILAYCAGDTVTPPPPPPGPDFSVSVSPVSASAVLGNSTSAVTISLVPEHGFNNSVDFTLQGLPQGVDATPPSFSLTPGTSQSVTFSVSPSAEVGVFPVIRYWTQFAKSGDPNSSSIPFWRQYDATTDEFQSLVAPTPMAEFQFARDHKCDFWDKLLGISTQVAARVANKPRRISTF